MNPHASAARLRKAIALADILTARGFTLEHIANMTPHHWHIVATAAGVNPPSEETVKMVVEMLSTRESIESKMARGVSFDSATQCE